MNKLLKTVRGRKLTRLDIMQICSKKFTLVVEIHISATYLNCALNDSEQLTENNDRDI